jgi:hypothetical protein
MHYECIKCCTYVYICHFDIKCCINLQCIFLFFYCDILLVEQYSGDFIIDYVPGFVLVMYQALSCLCTRHCLVYVPGIVLFMYQASFCIEFSCITVAPNSPFFFSFFFMNEFTGYNTQKAQLKFRIQSL